MIFASFTTKTSQTKQPALALALRVFTCLAESFMATLRLLISRNLVLLILFKLKMRSIMMRKLLDLMLPTNRRKKVKILKNLLKKMFKLERLKLMKTKILKNIIDNLFKVTDKK